MGEFLKAFRALVKMPVGLWLVIGSFSLDAMAYFGVITLMSSYLQDDFGMSEKASTMPVSAFTMSITLCWMAFGPIAEKMGARRGMLLALTLSTVGRFAYAAAVFLGGFGLAIVALGLVSVSIAEGMVQSAAYLGVKQYTDEKTSSMGYAMLYACMNLVQVPLGPMSSQVRTTADAMHAAGKLSISGFSAVNWMCALITLGTLVAYFALMTPKRAANMVRPPPPDENHPKKPPLTRVAEFFAGKESPFRDARFVFFIFMLLPVRTLFAHQWLTLPKYILRSYSADVADRMEWLAESFNPLVIFVAVPLFTAMTKRFNVYTMMIVGTTVSAASTFLLCVGPSLSMLVAYIFLFSIGEALWSCLLYTSDAADE